MESERLPQNDQTDNEVDEDISKAVDEEPLPLTSREARLMRALEYQAESIRKDDPLEASVGGLNGGLIRIACYLEDAIEQALAMGPGTCAAIGHLGSALDAYMRVTRQIDRFAQFEHRVSEASKDAASSPKRLQMMALQGQPRSGKRKKKGLIPTDW